MSGKDRLPYVVTSNPVTFWP